MLAAVVAALPSPCYLLHRTRMRGAPAMRKKASHERSADPHPHRQHSGAAALTCGGTQARCTERMNLWQSCENSAATFAASSAPRRLATEAASQPVTAALAASSACTLMRLPHFCWTQGTVVLCTNTCCFSPLLCRSADEAGLLCL